MKSLLTICVMMFSMAASASDMALSGLLGFDRGAINIGADLDFQNRESHSVGGYFIMATEDDEVRQQFWSLGADVKVFFGPDTFKLYLAPGIGIASFDVGNDSEMTFGSILKVGALFEVTYDIYVGLEHMIYNNWFNADAPQGFSLTNATVRINF